MIDILEPLQPPDQPTCAELAGSEPQVSYYQLCRSQSPKCLATSPASHQKTLVLVSIPAQLPRKILRCASDNGHIGSACLFCLFLVFLFLLVLSVAFGC